MKTLEWALNQVRRGGTLSAALNGLVGCPPGGWAETAQAVRRLSEALPHRAERSFAASDLIDACLMEVGGTASGVGRYAWRPEFATPTR